ncbi:MAG: lysine transporter LysE [Flavobacteriaceae bacterium]|nr:MAG: lysine transporter LysE [Flavobacteriaceae bacterium]
MNLLEIKDAVLIGFFLSFMIGPVFFTLIQTSILKGARAAIAFDLGVVLGDIAFILIAYYGSRSLLEKIKDDPRIFFIGGLILVVYGLITYFSKKAKSDDNKAVQVPEKSNYFGLILKGFLLNFINIGVLAFWLGMILVIGPELDMDSGKIFNYFGVILISYFITDLGKIFLAKQLKKRMTPKVINKVQRTMGIILVIFGVVLILKGFLPKYKLSLDTGIEKVE